MRFAFVIPVGVVLGLSACTAPINSNPGPVESAQVFLEEPVRPDGTTRGTTEFCDPNDYREILGQDQSVIQQITFGGEIRVIRPGDNADPTQYDANRLNVSVNDLGNIRAVTCG